MNECEEQPSNLGTWMQRCNSALTKGESECSSWIACHFTTADRINSIVDVLKSTFNVLFNDVWIRTNELELTLLQVIPPSHSGYKAKRIRVSFFPSFLNWLSCFNMIESTYFISWIQIKWCFQCWSWFSSNECMHKSKSKAKGWVGGIELIQSARPPLSAQN